MKLSVCLPVLFFASFFTCIGIRSHSCVLIAVYTYKEWSRARLLRSMCMQHSREAADLVSALQTIRTHTRYGYIRMSNLMPRWSVEIVVVPVHRVLIVSMTNYIYIYIMFCKRERVKRKTQSSQDVNMTLLVCSLWSPKSIQIETSNTFEHYRFYAHELRHMHTHTRWHIPSGINLEFKQNIQF